MKITSATPFPELSHTAGLLSVAGSVAAVVEELIPGAPPFGDRPIALVYNAEGPRTLWNEQDQKSKSYRVRLSTKGALWQQFAYQLSHELGHIKLGPARSNLLIETFAVAISIRALELLTDAWAKSPPFPWNGWAKYAAGLPAYIEGTRATSLRSLPADIRDGFAERSVKERLAWLATSRNATEKLPLAHEQSRAWQHVAVTTLDGKNVKWAKLLGLAMQTAPSPMEHPEYMDSLPVLPAAVPEWVPSELR